MEWTEEISLKLIELYRENPVLWDPGDKNFKLTKRKIDIWKKIGSEFGRDEGEVRKKMESLLTSYRREVRREGTTHSGMGTSELYHSKWFAFKAMQFLNDKFHPRKTQNTDNVSDFAQVTHDNDELDLIDISRDENEDEENQEEIVELNPTMKSKPKSVAHPVRATKREAEDPRIGAAWNIMQSIAEKRSKKNEKNECTLYGEYVGSQLEKFDERTRAVVKHEIGNILFHAEMGKYHLQTIPQFNTSPTPSYASLPSPSPYRYYGQQFGGQYQKFNYVTTVPSPIFTSSPTQSQTATLGPAAHCYEKSAMGEDNITF